MDANDLKRAHLEAMRNFHYREYLKYCRLLREPEKPMDKAEVHRIAESIGRNVTHRAWQAKNTQEPNGGVVKI